MKRSLPFVVAILFFISHSSKAQNICTQQFSNLMLEGVGNGIAVADAEAIVNDILNVMGLKGNFEIRAADIPNAAAVVYNGKRYVMYNPQFISRLNNATGSDWASVSVLAHEIGHHLNGHTLSGGSEPGRELEADEFSGYIMQRLGATLEEAETAMKLAADIKGTATHPGRTARITAIEEGWNRASDQLAADIDANEKDSAGTIKEQPVTTHSTSSKNVQVPTEKTPVALLREDILAEVFFEEDRAGQYYILTNGSLVAEKDGQLYALGQLRENNSKEYPYIIQSKNNRLYIGTTGSITDERGAVVGEIRERM